MSQGEHEGGTTRVDHPDPRVAVVALFGEHDLATAAALEGELDGLLNEGRNLVVDVSGATFVDSSTLNLLVRARQRASESGLGLVLLYGDDAPVSRAFEVTGLLELFTSTTDRERAVALAGETPV